MSYGINYPSLYQSLMNAYNKYTKLPPELQPSTGEPAKMAVPYGTSDVELRPLPSRFKVGIPISPQADAINVSQPDGIAAREAPAAAMPTSRVTEEIVAAAPAPAMSVKPTAMDATVLSPVGSSLGRSSSPGISTMAPDQSSDVSLPAKRPLVIYHGPSLRNMEVYNPTDALRAEFNLTKGSPALPQLGALGESQDRLDFQQNLAEREFESQNQLRLAQADSYRRKADLDQAQIAATTASADPEMRQTQILLEAGKQNPALWQNPEFKQKIGIPVTTTDKIALLQSQNPFLDVRGGLTQLQQGEVPGSTFWSKFQEPSRWNPDFVGPDLSPPQRIERTLSLIKPDQAAQWRRIAEALGILPPLTTMAQQDSFKPSR